METTQVGKERGTPPPTRRSVSVINQTVQFKTYTLILQTGFVTRDSDLLPIRKSCGSCLHPHHGDLCVV
jgi:hypothetical protein